MNLIKKLVTISLILTILITTTSCSVKEQKKYSAQFLELFNTITEIIAYSDSKEDFSAFAQLIYDNLEEYHKLYDKYNNYDGINNIKTINDNAGIKPVKVDQRIIDLLLFSKNQYQQSEGKVNIAMGSVLEIWHEYREDGINNPETASLPPMEQLEAANMHTDIDKLIIDEASSTVYLSDANMRLDVGAIAKGYATEQVSQIAKNNGYKNFLLSVGGNVRSMGTKGPKKELWSVGIQNPDKTSEKKSLYTLSLTNLSLVSSGNYERYYTVNGKVYHHIIDPVTLMPAEYFTSVSIVCEDSGLADALSTTIYNMPLEEGKALIESLEDVEALWVLPNGEIKYSEHFEELIKQ
ncbi:FAD:protein FMN transferase [Anaerocolumna aminovalerica]|uniref:FAD:protein FMN transferase n=1 Tax=Anaerocolumna aminovalerica TaxID=1527 RepID=A0A1I5J2N3_9FIRM|nr:FAD:protein FMN transferase [Anaerocolumna aminovalerica]MBU5334356.1 FAD:protein FMN transferase [Anaerocolumna aminovalerica]SFO67114.1 thiamine biosynthesis lipoprotein [Anaerocolumna aminovalerica]